MWFLSCDSQTMRKPFWHLHDTFWCSCFSILMFTETCAGNKSFKWSQLTNLVQTTFTAAPLKKQLTLPNHALISVISVNLGEGKVWADALRKILPMWTDEWHLCTNPISIIDRINVFQIGITFHIICKPFVLIDCTGLPRTWFCKNPLVFPG